MRRVTEAAPAKVNLFLHVLGRRRDGYHLLDSLIAFAAVADAVIAYEADGLSLTIAGPFGNGLSAGEDNLVIRAARALADAAGVAPRARLVLEKELPVASGIGGGSADAAATLRALVKLWRLAPDPAVLDAVALTLGADVPACLSGQPSRMGGIGERLTPLPALPPFGLLLANPGIPLSTAEVFGAREGDFSGPADIDDTWPDASAFARALAACRNDLEPAARRLCPAIAVLLEAIGAAPGCLLARMSGSGATCFGIFPDRPSAAAASAGLASNTTWTWGGAPLTCALP